MNKEKRDYYPKDDRDVPSRMSEGASAEDGLCGRMTATRRGAHYRKYVNKDGTEDRGRKYEGYFDE